MIFLGCGNSECVKADNNNNNFVRSDRLEVVGLFRSDGNNNNNNNQNSFATAAFFCGVGVGRDGADGNNNNNADGTDAGEGIIVRTAGPFVLRSID